MKSAHRRVVFLLLMMGALFFFRPSPLMAAAEPSRLTVGVKVSPPFVYRAEDGAWRGLTVDLWRAVAEAIGRPYRFREMSLTELLDAVERGEIDLAAAALTMTAEREAKIDFSHPYFTSGLGIAIPRRTENSPWTSVLGSLFSWAFLKALAALAALLLAAGLLVWVFERKRNPAHFGGSSLKGIGSGFWWSAVTMTTVGYGDKAPVTMGGRLVGIVWMFTGILTISTFTAMIASALTVSTFQESLVRSPADLYRVRVGTVRDTTSQAYAADKGIVTRLFDTPTDALAALADGSLDAVVYDAPILRHLIKSRWEERVEVLHGRFKRQEYALAFPQGSPLREEVNRTILAHQAGQTWRKAIIDHLGVQDGGW